MRCPANARHNKPAGIHGNYGKSPIQHTSDVVLHNLCKNINIPRKRKQRGKV